MDNPEIENVSESPMDDRTAVFFLTGLLDYLDRRGILNIVDFMRFSESSLKDQRLQFSDEQREIIQQKIDIFLASN